MSLRFKRVSGKAGHHIKALYILSVCLGLVIENPLWPWAAKSERRFPRGQIIHCLDRKEGSSCMVTPMSSQISGGGQRLGRSQQLLHILSSHRAHHGMKSPTSSPCTCRMYEATVCRHLLQTTPRCFLTTRVFSDAKWTNKDAGSSFYTDKLQLEGHNLWAVPHCTHFPFNQPLMVTVALPLDSPISCSLWSTMAPNTGRHIMNQHTTNS